MSENIFNRLPGFIQEYIYTHGWTELRAIQVEACKAIFNTDSHLLLSSGTASGKTEAAFLPVLTMLHENPPSSLGVLYIGPMKALINDQFVRLNGLLAEADIPVWHWHGDVPQSEKTKLAKNPQGVLQITPESIESLLLNKKNDLVRFFGDLRFVIIDEVHCFMGSERGRQILCQLERLAAYMGNSPRRIGLSATLGDYTLAEEWLSSGTERDVITPSVPRGQHKIRLAVENFVIPSEIKKSKSKTIDPVMDMAEETVESEIETKHELETEDEIQEDEQKDREMYNPYWKYIHERSKSKKCIIFTNSRFDAELSIATLRYLSEREGLPDIYHVHHGNISAPLRETAETAMRESKGPLVIGATMTLELGIDIGELERVIQLKAPSSVASFLQRLGRSGRRGVPSEMFFVSREEEPIGRELLTEQIPWQLLQSVAIIQLYLEERWIEPITPAKCPFSLLYHQTMSILASAGELSPAALARRVLSLTPFKNISLEDYKDLLNHMIKTDHLQQTENQGLIVGLAGEKIVDNYRFYAVFPEDEEYSVRDESKEIGCIGAVPPIGERFALAGRIWEVIDYDMKRRTIFVKHVRGKVKTTWTNDYSAIHTRILERMRQVLFENTEYPYLQPGARKRIYEARQFAYNAGLDRYNIFSLGGNSVCILPWVGTHTYRALYRTLIHSCKEPLGIQGAGGYRPYYITMHLKHGEPKDLLRLMKDSLNTNLSYEVYLNDKDIPIMNRYDDFLPENLLKKSYVNDFMDFDELKRVICNWQAF